jgi:co-chaperonin GroES (HSP10)
MNTMDDQVLFFGPEQRYSVDHLRVYRGKVIVELELKPEITPGGIIVPYRARIQMEPHKTARVLKVHPDFTAAHGVHEDNRVLLANFGTDHYLDHKPWRICVVEEEEILCLIDDD